MPKLRDKFHIPRPATKYLTEEVTTLNVRGAGTFFAELLQDTCYGCTLYFACSCAVIFFPGPLVGAFVAP